MQTASSSTKNHQRYQKTTSGIFAVMHNTSNNLKGRTIIKNAAPSTDYLLLLIK